MLSKVHEACATPYLLVPLCSLFLIFSCKNNETALLEPPETSQHQAALLKVSFDGKALYKGIFQGRGPVADFIPEIRDHLKLEYFVDASHLADVVQIQDKVLESLTEIDPNFFDEFATAMTSGDHLKIKKELEEAGKVTAKAVLNLPESQQAVQFLKENPDLVDKEISARQDIDKSKVDEIVQSLANGSYTPNALCGLFLVCVVWVVIAVDIAVVSNAAVALAAAVAIGLVVWIAAGPVPAGQDLGEILPDQIINSIAVMLGD